MILMMKLCILCCTYKRVFFCVGVYLCTSAWVYTHTHTHTHTDPALLLFSKHLMVIILPSFLLHIGRLGRNTDPFSRVLMLQWDIGTHCLSVSQGIVACDFPLQEEELWSHPGSLSHLTVTKQLVKTASFSRCQKVLRQTVSSFSFCWCHLFTFRISEQSSLGNTVSVGRSNDTFFFFINI